MTFNGAALTAPLVLVGPAKTLDQCRPGVWQTFNFPLAFRSQGECVVFVLAASAAPKVTVPANMQVEATSPAGAMVTFTATATDVIQGSIPVTCTPPSGSIFPIGDTIVTCSAINSRGSGDVKSFRISVRDTRPPQIVSVTPSVSVLPDTDQQVPVTLTVVATDIQFAPWLDCVADAQRLPLADATAANIVMIDVLHHLEFPVVFFREAARVLRPGGLLGFSGPKPRDV